jgi:hypothetical protein
MALFLASGMSLVVAGETADGSRPRTFELQKDFHRIELPSNFMGAALGTGKPPGLSHFGTWMTSDHEPDEFSTSFVWCDFETLAVVQVVYLNSSKPLKISVKVTTDSGAIAFTDAGPYVPDGGEGFYELIDVFDPPLLPGAYKVTMKTAQGDRIVGGQLWILVVAGSDPFCLPAEAALRNRKAVISKPHE